LTLGRPPAQIRCALPGPALPGSGLSAGKPISTCHRPAPPATCTPHSCRAPAACLRPVHLPPCARTYHFTIYLHAPGAVAGCSPVFKPATNPLHAHVHICYIPPRPPTHWGMEGGQGEQKGGRGSQRGAGGASKQGQRGKVCHSIHSAKLQHLGSPAWGTPSCPSPLCRNKIRYHTVFWPKGAVQPYRSAARPPRRGVADLDQSPVKTGQSRHLDSTCTCTCTCPPAVGCAPPPASGAPPPSARRIFATVI
jgi:hypothetical protein